MTFRRDKKKKLLYQHGRCQNKNEVITTEIPARRHQEVRREVYGEMRRIGWQVRRPVCSSVRERWRIVRPLQYVPTWGVRGLRVRYCLRRPICSSVRERWRIVRPLQYVPTWGVRGLRTVLSRPLTNSSTMWYVADEVGEWATTNRECASGERTWDLLLR